MLFLALTAILPIQTSTSNVLVTTAWNGGHFALDIALTLADVGHNVTYLDLFYDENILVPDTVTHVTPSTILGKVQSLDFVNEIALRSGALKGASSKMISSSITGSPEVLKEMLNQFKIMYDFYFGEEMERILTDTQFDLFFVDEVLFYPVATLSYIHKIPLITVIPVVDQQRAKHEQNLPAMLVSEASQFLNVHGSTPPSFMERVYLFLHLVSFILDLVPGIIDIMKPHLIRAGLDGLTDLNNMTELYLVNDHPALSFPNMKAPNSINMAGLRFGEQNDAMEPELAEFIGEAKNEGKSIVFLSLGDVAFSTASDDYQEMFGDKIFSALQEVNLAVIVRCARKIENLELNVYARSWLPRKAILESSTIDLFISSCENTAKIEAVLSKVPILCIPLFADQYFNSLLVERNGFGKTLLTENFSHAILVDIVTEMLKDALMYKRKMQAASVAVHGNPSSPDLALIFYTQQILSNGNLKYLKNNVITKQNFLEINNIDVFFAGSILLLVSIGVIFRVVKLLTCRVRAKYLNLRKAKNE